MKTKLLLIFLMVFALAVPADAVLKEKDLGTQLEVLRHELTTYHREQQDRLLDSKIRSEQVMSRLREIMEKSSLNALMLYSQKTDYVFDLTYACHEATKQYHDFQRFTAPFKEYVAQSNSDIARYDSLVDMLSKMPTMVLDEKAKIDRNVCLTLAVNIRRMLKDANEALSEPISKDPSLAKYAENDLELKK